LERKLARSIIYKRRKINALQGEPAKKKTANFTLISHKNDGWGRNASTHAIQTGDPARRRCRAKI